MPENRKKLITPPTLSDHEYTKKWQQVKYFGKKIDDNEDKYETSWGLKEYIWEHLGRLDDAEYIEKNLK